MRGLAAGEVLQLDFDAEARTLRFSCGEEALGEFAGVGTGAAADVKLVVSMWRQGQAVELLQLPRDSR